VIEEVRAQIPAYARPADEVQLKAVRLAVDEAVRRFVDRIENPDAPWDPEPFRTIGRGEATAHRSLEPFQSAMRLGARVAWRRLTEQAGSLELSPQTLYDLGEAIFAYLDQLADAAAEGFDETRARVAEERDRRRRRLLDLLLAEPAASPGAVSDLAETAGWRLPATVAAIALDERSAGSPVLPPDVLAGLDRPMPCVLVPDPGRQGHAELLEAGLRGWQAAVGPAVPLGSAAASLRWARDALALARRGVLDDRRPLIRCVDHMSTLIVFKDEDLVRALAEVRLAPMAALRPSQQDRLAETLLAWLRHGRGVGEVAARLHVHPQTVRYRLRQLERLYGEQLGDPEIRFELEIVLRARQAASPAGPSRVREPRVRESRVRER
jgi:hypothetical protein